MTDSGITSAFGCPAQNSRIADVWILLWFALPQIGLLPCTQAQTTTPMQAPDDGALGIDARALLRLDLLRCVERCDHPVRHRRSLIFRVRRVDCANRFAIGHGIVEGCSRLGRRYRHDARHGEHDAAEQAKDQGPWFQGRWLPGPNYPGQEA